MRALFHFVAVALLFGTPASGQELFVNDAMGFQIRLPDGYVRTYADNEMAVFKSADGTREVALLGGNSFDPLERLTERHMGYDGQDGWTTRLLSSTPSWAAYAGSRNGQQMVVRMIEMPALAVRASAGHLPREGCGRDRAAARQPWRVFPGDGDGCVQIVPRVDRRGRSPRDWAQPSVKSNR